MLHRNTYCALFEAIGYTYGGEGDTFKVPDPRGLFLRCLDAGRGIDPGRALGSVQQSGAPNITGYFTVDDYVAKLAHTGAFTKTSTDGSAYDAASTFQIGNYRLHFNASLCSHVYQEGLTEVRPANLAVNIIIKY